MNKCDIKIMGIPDRMPNISRLCLKLGLSKNDVYLDMEHTGLALTTSIHAFTLPFEDDITHRCVIQDDVDVCDEFKWFVNYLVQKYPDDVFSLFNRSKIGSDFSIPSIAKMGGQIWGPAVIIPRKYIERIYNEWKNVYWWRGADDSYYANWCYRNKIRVLGTIPCSVSHLGVSCSSLCHSEIFSDMWYKSNGFNIEWKDATDLSLRDNDFPRNIDIKKEIKSLQKKNPSLYNKLFSQKYKNELFV